MKGEGYVQLHREEWKQSMLFNFKRRKLVKKKILFTDIKDDSISKIIKNENENYRVFAIVPQIYTN